MIQPAPPSPRAQPAFFTAAARPAEPPPRVQAMEGRNGVLACLGRSSESRAVVGHALAVAKSLGLAVTLARVLDVPRSFGSPADPVEWQLRRSRGRVQLDQLARFEALDAPDVDSVLLSGPPAEELSRWAADHDVTMMVLGTRDGATGDGVGLGTTAQRLLAGANASLLLVPPSSTESGAPDYRRLLVPLDGSSRAESVLPIAIRIARAHKAEVILAHVVPPLEVVQQGFLDSDARELRDRLDARNDENARAYLGKLRRGMLGDAFPVRTLVARDGDPRAQLRRLAAEQAADLIIIASHGASGLADVPCGSVTEYLATHAPAPLLIIRSTFTVGFAESARAGPDRIDAAAH